MSCARHSRLACARKRRSKSYRSVSGYRLSDVVSLVLTADASGAEQELPRTSRKGGVKPPDGKWVVPSGFRQPMWLVLAGLLVFAPCAWTQLQVGENSTLHLNGLASLGYRSVFDSTDTNSLAWGFSGNLTGEYYDPRFLNFSVSPYINQSRLNSTYYSTTTATGVNAVANFLSGSHTPMQFSYERDHNSEGTFNVPGSTGNYKTVGNGQGFGVSASYLPEGWPSLQGNFSHTASSYEIIGMPGTGTTHTNAFGLSAGYELWGTNLSGSYSRAYVDSEHPAFGEPGVILKQHTHQDTLQFAASRRLWDSTTLSANFGRSHIHGDYQDTRTDATFDTVGALLMMKPTPRFGVNFSVNYSSNLSAQFLSGILGGSSGATVGSGAVALKPESQNPTFTSNYLTYGTVASYRATRELTFTGNINRQVQGQPGQPDATSTSMGGGAVWSHEFLGGTLGAHYAIAHYFVPSHTQSSARSSTFTGHNTGVSYSRRLLGWSGSTSFSYARSLTTFLVGYVQSNYTANVSVSRVIGTWSLGLN